MDGETFVLLSLLPYFLILCFQKNRMLFAYLLPPTQLWGCFPILTVDLDLPRPPELAEGLAGPGSSPAPLWSRLTRTRDDPAGNGRRCQASCPSVPPAHRCLLLCNEEGAVVISKHHENRPGSE